MRDVIEKFKLYGPKQFFLFALDELIKKFYFQLIKGSYSQKQEDLIIDRLLGNKKQGFYVDVGAFDPHRISNTKRFYRKGWCGINIEPNATNYEKFLKDRPRDINLNVGIGKENAVLTFYKFFPGTLSTFSKKEAKKYEEEGYRLVEETKVEVTTLANVLEKYALDKYIDFLSVDTEGFDMFVLKSNNWKKFKPKIICIEGDDSEIDSFLKDKGYEKACATGLNSIYLFEK